MTSYERVIAERDDARDLAADRFNALRGAQAERDQAHAENVAACRERFAAVRAVAGLEAEVAHLTERAEKAEAALTRVRTLFGLDSEETCGKLAPEERDPDCVECLVANALDGTGF